MPSENSHEDEKQLITRNEFEKLSQKLSDKTEKISGTLESHDKQIGKLNQSIDEIGRSMDFMERHLKDGLSGIDKRITDINNFLMQQNETMQKYNDKSDQTRTDKLDHQLEVHGEILEKHMDENDQKINKVVNAVKEIKETFNSNEERKRAFWTNITTAVVGVLIALINIVPLLLDK